MNGYDLYYNSMKNRIEGLYAIDVSVPEGLVTLKHWLYDHLEGSDVGGVANFYAGIIFPYELLPGTPEAGKAVILEWYQNATHAMTIVGYNDSIRFDYNGDGHYTNDQDINDDGEVTMRDWEIGGLKFVNSYGEQWGDDGFCYMMYKTLAEIYGQGGIWNNTVNVIKLREPYEPWLTMKVKLRHTSRGKIKVMAGISPDTSFQLPSRVIEVPVFNYQGGDIYMQGGWDEEDKTIEFGLDITPLLSYTVPGTPARFFLLVEENDPLNEHSGELVSYSLIDYLEGAREYICSEAPLALNNNDLTMLSVVRESDVPTVKITEETLPALVEGAVFSHQFSATGGRSPYTWNEQLEYISTSLNGPYPDFLGEEVITNQSHDGYAVRALGFPFPFYGNFYDSVYMFTSGSIMFHRQDSFWPYVLDMGLFLSSNRLIAPFMAEALMVRDANGDGIWFQATQDQALIRWNLTDQENLHNSSFDFILKLSPDGTIEFHYGEFLWKDNRAG
jgi:hypothetical protein